MASEVQRAILGLVMDVLFSDGELAEEEFLWLSRRLSQHPVFADLSSDDFHSLCLSVRDELGFDRSDRSLGLMNDKWARTVPPSLALQTYEFVLEALFSDGRIDDTEARVVVKMGTALGLPHDIRSATIDRVADRMGFRSRRG